MAYSHVQSEIAKLWVVEGIEEFHAELHGGILPLLERIA